MKSLTIKNMLQMEFAAEFKSTTAIYILLALGTPLLFADKITLCYMSGWSQRQIDWGRFLVHDADTTHCTHVVYAFMTFDVITTALEYKDDFIDIDLNGTKLNQVAQLQFLKLKNPKLKVMASMGGWTQGGRKFSDLARDPEKIKSFVANVERFLIDYSLDGLDICWQFPGERGGRPEDKVTSLNLFRALKGAFQPKGWLLTVHILGKLYVMEKYNIKAVSDIVDYINLVAVEYNGPWERKTGIMAPLTSRDEHNVLFSVEYMLAKGANSSKILLGLPLYGHAYLLTEVPKEQKLGLNSTSTFISPRTNEGGVIAYSEMCYYIKSNKDWELKWDAESQTPIAYKKKKFVSYDNETSLRLKADLVHSKSLGGIAFWSLDMDDFHGLCHHVKYPLVSSISDYINNRTPTSAAFTNKIVLCYMLSKAIKRPDLGRFSAMNADNDFCTHIVYGFMGIDNVTNKISTENLYFESELHQLINLKRSKENLKVLISVGGIPEESEDFSKMARSMENRSIFIDSLVNFLKDFDLDGVDLSWHLERRAYYGPIHDKFIEINATHGQPRLDDRKYLTKLLKELKVSLEPEGFLLTLHVNGHREELNFYNIKKLSRIVDYINLAAMDYHDTKQRRLGATTPLTSSDDSNVKSSLDYILKIGVPSDKILLGLPLFGRVYELQEAPRGKFIGLYYKYLPKSKWTNESGFIAYNELCSDMILPDSSWINFWEEISETPISYRSTLIAFYENKRSLQLKTRLVGEKKLAGVMIWTLDMDDFHGLCHGEKYPLLSAISETLKKITLASEHSKQLNYNNITGKKGPTRNYPTIVSYQYGQWGPEIP